MMTNNKKPTHKIVTGTENGDKTFWTEVGAAWEHSKGFSCKLNSNLALVGEFQLFKITEKTENK